MGDCLGTPGAAGMGFHINAAKVGVVSVRYGPTNWWKYVVLVAVVVGAGGVVAGGWLGTRALLNRPPLASLRALG